MALFANNDSDDNQKIQTKINKLMKKFLSFNKEFSTRISLPYSRFPYAHNIELFEIRKYSFINTDLQNYLHIPFLSRFFHLGQRTSLFL